MINKVKRLIKENREVHHQILLNTKESVWASVYHDSIRGKEWIEKTSLNIGRWAGSYAFFYILNRILSDFCPDRILELGLGESSKMILNNRRFFASEAKHIIVEHDKKWIECFKEKNELTKGARIVHCELIQRDIKGYTTNAYNDFCNQIKDDFDLYIVDGPFGSKHYSRYDIVNLLSKKTSKDEFVIIFDDSQRQGEKETIVDIFNMLNSNGIQFFYNYYEGIKSTLVIATSKYKYVTSL